MTQVVKVHPRPGGRVSRLPRVRLAYSRWARLFDGAPCPACACGRFRGGSLRRCWSVRSVFRSFGNDGCSRSVVIVRSGILPRISSTPTLPDPDRRRAWRAVARTEAEVSHCSSDTSLASTPAVKCRIRTAGRAARSRASEHCRTRRRARPLRSGSRRTNASSSFDPERELADAPAPSCGLPSDRRECTVVPSDRGLASCRRLNEGKRIGQKLASLKRLTRP